MIAALHLWPWQWSVNRAEDEEVDEDVHGEEIQFSGSRLIE